MSALGFDTAAMATLRSLYHRGLEAAHRLVDTGTVRNATTPAIVIGGYLGAGKTTLINRLLARPGSRRIAVLVNDFGRIGIDGSLIRSRSGETLELANGCICCTISSGIGQALDALAAREEQFDAIVIEASGVSNPGKIAQFAKSPGLRPAGVYVAVDAERVRTLWNDRLIGTEVQRQIRAADVLIVTKADLVSREELAACRYWLASVAPGTVLLDATNADVVDRLFDGVEHPRDERAGEAPGEHDGLYEAWSYESDDALQRSALYDFVAALPGVLRAKGIVRFTDEPDARYVVHVVGKRSSIVLDEHLSSGNEPSRLTIISTTGSGLPDACERLAERYLGKVAP